MEKNKSIQNKLMEVILITTTVVLLLTCAAYFGYEYYSFRRTTVDHLSVISKMIAANSTAALAFENTADAEEVLSSLEVEPNILAAVLYDSSGNLFAQYRSNTSIGSIPQTRPDWQGFRFEKASISGLQPVTHEGTRLGTLYITSNIQAMYDRFTLYLGIAALVISVSFLVAYLLSNKLQKNFSRPILDLAATARIVSENTDYSVRAKKYANDEVGSLTDAFNKMLVRIEQQNQEIKSFNQELEDKVKERTRELEVAYREMEAFSYTVSHDLNAPLRHIDSFLGIFLAKYEDGLDESAKKTLNNVTKNARKMRQLIDDLLAFSQLGRKELQRSQVSMKDLVVDIIAEHPKAADPLINISIQNLPDAFVDSVTIRQVWENLISNAIKYSQHKEASEINIGWEEKPDVVIYYIRDNGAGFNMKNYDKLFNPFQRLHNQSQFEGTGVGLAIVERIITKHGGKVWAESKVDQGATFYFSIPRIK